MTNKNNYPKLILLDGDQYCFKVAAALEKAVDWGDGIHTIFSDDREGVVTLEKAISDIFQRLEGDAITIALSSPKNFRKKLDASYKDNRRDMRKPLIYAAMRDFMVKSYPCKEVDWLEADDVMGIMATNPKESRDIVLVSDDKDMMQIPGTLYRPASSTLMNITPEEGFRFHMYQTLVGDRADNYPGCPKIGEAKAKRILDDTPVGDLWAAVVDAFKSQKLTEEDALLQARLSKILQFENFNIKERKVKLWQPKA
jgi:DNA polymerase-1